MKTTMSIGNKRKQALKPDPTFQRYLPKRTERCEKKSSDLLAETFPINAHDDPVIRGQRIPLFMLAYVFEPILLFRFCLGENVTTVTYSLFAIPSTVVNLLNRMDDPAKSGGDDST